MKLADRLYLMERRDSSGWDLVSAVPKDSTLRRKALVELVASGCSRQHAAAALRVSQATLTRDLQALERAEPSFGTDAWRLAHLERQAEELRRQIERDEAEAN